MSDRKPLVIGSDSQLQQLQKIDDLDIPLNDRVALLEQQMIDLGKFLANQNIGVPPSIMERF